MPIDTGVGTGAVAGTVPSQQPSERETTTMVLPASPDTPPTELRVHGVSGSPAEDVLDRPLIVQVAGDGEAGFFRPRPDYGATLGPGGARLEAYRWGNLTSGTPRAGLRRGRASRRI